MNNVFISPHGEHDYNKAYEKYSIVTYTENDTIKAYLAIKPVHPFISINDRNFWKELNCSVLSDDGGSGTDFVSDLIIPIRRFELLGMIGHQELIPGMRYRITDYECITIQKGTDSANHLFDIIVLADSVDTLNENAFAIQHNGDSYFDNSNLDAWKLKYCIYNDDSRFGWVSDKAGKGVIYYMRDEYGNEAPYDFKNILFDSYVIDSVTIEDNQISSDTSDYLADAIIGKYITGGFHTKQLSFTQCKDPFKLYTFSDDKGNDLSIMGCCIGNVIKPTFDISSLNPDNLDEIIKNGISQPTMILNNIVIVSSYIYFNTFDYLSFDIRITCNSIVSSKFNTICNSILIGGDQIAACNFGHGCYNIVIGNGDNDTCIDIILGDGNSNMLFVGNRNITTNNNCSNIIISENITNVDISDNVSDICLDGPSGNTTIKNIKVLQGINNESNNHDIIHLALDGHTGDFQTIVSQDENGNIVYWMAKDGGYGGIPVETSLPQSRGILPNVLYKLGTLADNSSTTINLSSPTDVSIANIYHLTFDTPDFGNDISSRGPSITWVLPFTTIWADGAAPTLEPNMNYEVSIMDNIVCVVSAEKYITLLPEP